MKNFLKGKVVTGLVVLSTLVLAGIAIFTALRLYQLRQENLSPLSPESQPLAWDCSTYTFNVSSSGIVSVNNQSTHNETPQQARVFINNNLVATLAVPALPRGQSSSLGTVEVPADGFSWRVEGSVDCDNSGTSAAACRALTFTLTENSPTVTPVITSTVTPIVTDDLTPTEELTSTPIATATTIPTDVPNATNTPTPIQPPSIPAPPQCNATRPGAPTLLSVERSGTTAILKWTKVDLATHYVISYGLSPDNFQYGVPNTGNTTTYTIEKLAAGTKYYFTVYAVNDCMPSEGSKVITSVAGIATVNNPGQQLPATGFSIPTIFGIGAGILVIAAALILAI
jgi:hypothetical protein